MRRFLWRLFPWMFLVGGLVVLVAIGKEYYQEALLKERGFQTTGTVQWTSRYSKPCASSVRVTYADQGGRAFTKYFNVCSRQYQAGESINVIYLPADPSVASLAAPDVVPSSTQSVIGAVVAALCVVFGVGLLVALRRKQAP
jgi:hypothetical protein